MRLGERQKFANLNCEANLQNFQHFNQTKYTVFVASFQSNPTEMKRSRFERKLAAIATRATPPCSSSDSDSASDSDSSRSSCIYDRLAIENGDLDATQPTEPLVPETATSPVEAAPAQNALALLPDEHPRM